MASYLPHQQAPRVWQSEMKQPGPVRRVGVQAARSGSGRSYASTWKPGMSFARSGAALQQTTAQYGSYLIYRDQVRAQNEHLAALAAHHEEKAGAELNHTAGMAIEAMLGGVAKKSREPGTLGNPRTGGTPSSSSPSPQPVGGVGPSPRLPQQRMEGSDAVGAAPAWQKSDTFGSLSPEMSGRRAGPEQLSVFGRAGFQPRIDPW